MDDLRSMAVFAETVDAGSMSAAARRLGMSPSAVSQTIRTLEEGAGVVLLHRSTRKLRLTEAGERYYPHCKRVTEAARAGADALQLARDAPDGELRLSAPVGFAGHIAPALAPLLADAPQLRLRLLLDDAMIDLIDARIDLALRVGILPDSDWVARPLCQLATILCASPAYLARHGVPAAPQDLAGHQWLSLARADTRSSFQAVPLMLDLMAADGARQRIEVHARIASNNQVALQQMCEQGLGIVRAARADVAQALRQGALVQVLPAWRVAPLPVWALTPRREGEAAKVRAALDALRRYFASLPGERR